MRKVGVPVRCLRVLFATPFVLCRGKVAPKTVLDRRQLSSHATKYTQTKTDLKLTLACLQFLLVHVVAVPHSESMRTYCR